MAATKDKGAYRQRGQGVDREPEDGDNTAFRAAQHPDQQRHRRRHQRATNRDGRAKRRDQRASRLDHDEHADKADQYCRPALDSDLLAQDQRGEQGGENRDGKGDGCRIRQWQQRHRPEVETHGANPEQRSQHVQPVLVGDDRGPSVLAAPDQEADQRHRDQLAIE